MPHSPEAKKRVVTRLHRIKGQADALERAVEAGTSCGELLQQLAALRGAANGLMAEVLESHLRETFAPSPLPADGNAAGATPPVAEETLDQLMRIIRSYLT
ncbi:metal/formaldehyde-sensitive transcriptional repressor [Corticibacter populi]|uniref:Metal/formaldehyde-sensitive transcriptional repressor n=1 Tax=Corticibacter populi TaxID=1550736 RepID=A0A3M6R0M6_9BURK|nr:metal/formaldehyde-sensitive transcriptional repressor [Corticibacter populi]RMX08800.1 metal/formaldehyde-sensitive transcriptional repressor [Corticibacter populi]RZS30116.1 DNA-binding FrmR family transcriptional regulator [Corticibacter populi]